MGLHFQAECEPHGTPERRGGGDGGPAWPREPGVEGEAGSALAGTLGRVGDVPREPCSLLSPAGEGAAARCLLAYSGRARMEDFLGDEWAFWRRKSPSRKQDRLSY